MFGLKPLARIGSTLAALAALALPLGAHAEKPMSIIVPYGAGGLNDNFARVLAEGMSKELGRTIIVENKPGANGIIGASYVARAPADGSTILLGGTGPLSLNVLLRPNLPFGFDSFDSVAMLFEGPLTITVPTKLGVQSIPELVEYSRKNNQPLRFGTLGPGSVTDLYGLLMAKELDVKMLAVPYKTVPAALIDMLGGLGEVNMATPIALLEHQKAGSVKILALTTEQRDPALPDIPSVAELGYPQLRASYWTALHAPKGTPPEVVKKISDAAIKVVQTESFRELLRNNGQLEKTGGPDALDAQLETDRKYWGQLIKDNNIVLD
ncbi:tripartite tricarboxylate transporter substrate binding protein [Verticiella sediminum]|uniref:Tripartite tricarboxylate transporter substrate binding protein n=1 Tax=Verticiella sediminum TaxID=1247510 RepID=A0A556AIT6_9BURK|nr:tripartite tricarboxylate transporter substrate binding protein [Verticiella sediminum]TSH92780.1 tripartite tricarboxylate transporter substrate binding protein [Verticiella sediminum]